MDNRIKNINKKKIHKNLNKSNELESMNNNTNKIMKEIPKSNEELYKIINQLEQKFMEEKNNNEILNKQNIELIKKNQELNKK